LTKGQKQTITISYTISDGNGGTVPQTATITITGTAETVEVSYKTAQALYNAGTYFSADDQVSIALSNDDISTAGGLAGVSLRSLVTLGVDVIDINGSADNAALHISSLDAAAMSGADLSFAGSDTITLDVSAEDINVSGSYLSGSLSSAISGMSHGLSLSALGTLGVDVIDINGSSRATLHISTADAKAMHTAGLHFVDGDTISLDVGSFDDLNTLSGFGSYLGGSLNGTVTAASQGVSLSALGVLGVDVIDIGGSKNGAGNGRLHIDSTDTLAMRSAGLQFAGGDTITLDASTADDINVSGSYLSGSLNSAISGMSHGLSLSALGTLGVDVIDLNGSATNSTLHIGNADTLAMSSAGLQFASGDTITLDLSANDLGGTLQDGSGSGSYLAGTLDESLSNAGLSMSALGNLGVSVIDIGGSDESATLHISPSDAVALINAGLSFALGDTIVLDGTDFSGTLALGVMPDTSGGKLAAAVGDSLGLHALGIVQVEVDTGVMVTLHEDADMVFGADQSLKDLLIALGDSGITAHDMANSLDAVSAVKVSADASFTIDDAMVKALMDAGLLSANNSSTIEVDTESEHMSTSLSQLADIGADKVATSQDKVYVDLGEVSDADALSALLKNLVDGNSTLFVQQSDGAAVQEVGLVLTADQATLATAIAGDAAMMEQLAHVGITELLIATGDAQSQGDVILLGQEYHKVFVG
jgi:hypothetical protein